MSFPRYPEYKDSGVEWLDEVPSNWEVIPVRAFVEERTEKNSNADDENYLSLMANIGVIPYEQKGDIGNKKPDDLSKCKKVAVGDLVINSMNYGIGSYGISGLKGVCSPVYIVLRPIEYKVSPRYALRIFENREFQKLAQSFGQGILAHRAAISWDDLKGIKAPIPSSVEQANIAAFLDHEPALIDALVAEQQRLIELLKEKRQTVISHAVTKGLNPDVPMKDSGVEWLGEVPAHWEIRKLSSVTDKITNGYVGPTRGLFVDQGIPYLQSLHIKDNQIKFTPEYFVTKEWSDSHAKSILKPGDVLIVQTGDIGQIAVVPEGFPEANCHALIIASAIRCTLIGDWLAWLLYSDYGYHSLLSIKTGALHPHLNCGYVKDIHIPVPPIEEQTAIVDWIVDQQAGFMDLMFEAETMVGLLKERRSALISAAVTGKIDVRGWQPPPGSSSSTETTTTEPA